MTVAELEQAARDAGAEIAELIRQRDSARNVAVALEQELVEVRVIVREYAVAYTAPKTRGITHALLNSWAALYAVACAPDEQRAA